MFRVSVILLCYLTTNIFDTDFLVEGSTKVILVEDAKGNNTYAFKIAYLRDDFWLKKNSPGNGQKMFIST